MSRDYTDTNMTHFIAENGEVVEEGSAADPRAGLIAKAEALEATADGILARANALHDAALAVAHTVNENEDVFVEIRDSATWRYTTDVREASQAILDALATWRKATEAFAKGAMIVVALLLPVRLHAQAKPKPDTAAVARKRPWYDSTKAPKDTAWVASKKGHTYYLDGCRGTLSLTPANIVRFKTEAEAKAAGLSRSKQWGC